MPPPEPPQSPLTGLDRLDRVLVARGLMPSRAAAQAAIAAGGVQVNGAVVRRRTLLVAPEDTILAEPAHPYVSRGGVKLAHALSVWSVPVAGRSWLDIGASTGGFTQVLLQAGAARVSALDVGHGQLHESLRTDPRVRVLEHCDARDLARDTLDHPVQGITVDASFIGLAKLIGPALSLAEPGSPLIALFKPQFEVGPAHVGRGGIVTDLSAARAAEAAFCDWLTGQGWCVAGATDSPITGGDGNAERLILASAELP
jgi:23S rRNA (cytidine1920-2'-O)/16S rRNA (cytidine1409-2'-O)-methyltransferase